MLAVVIENIEQLELFMNPEETLGVYLWDRGTYWLSVVAVLSVVTLLASVVYSAVRNRSLWKGLRATVRGLVETVREIILLPTGYRRIGAIAALAFKEAIRRRVLWIFMLFLIPLLFVGWYLPNAEEGRLPFLVAFVTGSITWLLLPLVVFLTSMSMPNDLKNRTIQTVITKPVRRLEIVVGRTLGFTGIFTLVLLVMAGCGLAYLRGHAWALEEEVRDRQWQARSPVMARPVYDAETFGLPPSENPYPALLFRKRGVLSREGINVGKEWTYRSHITGPDEAHWYFTFDPTIFSGMEEVPVQMTLDIFKTTKHNPTIEGDATSGVFAGIVFIDRKRNVASDPRFVHINDNRLTEITAPGDLFRSGYVEVVVRCVTSEQYLGMAPPDLFLLAQRKSFEWNFVKAMVGVWLKVVLLIAVAVSASTALNGFVTILLTSTVYVVGLFHAFLTRFVAGGVVGVTDGPITTLIRLVTQQKGSMELEPTFENRVAKAIDQGLIELLEVVSRVIPDLSNLDMAYLVAGAVDVPPLLLVYCTLVVIGYVIPVMALGHVLLRAREIAA